MNLVIILVATHDEKAVEILRSVPDDPYTLLFANNLQQVPSILRDTPVDIIIVDEELGRQHITEILPQIKAINDSAALMVITGDPSADAIRDSSRQHSFEILGKPVRESELLEKIRGKAERMELLRELELLKGIMKKPGASEHIADRTDRSMGEKSLMIASLRKFIEAVVNIRDAQKFFELFVGALADFFMVTKAALVLLTAKGDKLEMKSCRGLDLDFQRQLDFEVNQGIYQWLRKHDWILITDNLSDDTASLEELARVKREAQFLGARLCVPLLSRERLIGYFSLGTKFTGEPYTSQEMEFIFALAGYLGLAIENVFSMEKTKQLAIKDELTDLYNRRHCQQSLRDEIDRCKRYGRPLSIAIYDIDHFKQINDTRGHPAGDRVLKQVAQILLERSRSTDFVGRYGGEEFIVILPETDIDLAEVYCERVRRSIEEFFDQEEGRDFMDLVVTISGGLTTLNQEEDTFDTLIERADQALYAAKQAGRNRIVRK